MNVHLLIEPYEFLLIFLEFFSCTAGDKGYLWLKSVRQLILVSGHAYSKDDIMAGLTQGGAASLYDT